MYFVQNVRSRPKIWGGEQLMVDALTQRHTIVLRCRRFNAVDFCNR